MLQNADLNTLNTSNQNIYNLMKGDLKEIPVSPAPAWVDVRNVAEAHVKALSTPAAENQRYFVVAGKFTFHQVAQIIISKFPELKEVIPHSSPDDLPLGIEEQFMTDGSKVERDLGVKYISLEKSISETAEQLLKWQKIAA